MVIPAPDVVLLELGAGELVAHLELERTALDERRTRGAIEDQVLGDGELADEPLLVAVLRDEADSGGVDDLAHRPADELLAVQADRPGDVVLKTHQRLGQLGLAVAWTPATASTSPSRMANEMPSTWV